MRLRRLGVLTVLLVLLDVVNRVLLQHMKCAWVRVPASCGAGGRVGQRTGALGCVEDRHRCGASPRLACVGVLVVLSA